jgi:hypothetical protein
MEEIASMRTARKFFALVPLLLLGAGAASAGAGTTGATSGASGGAKDAAAVSGGYQTRMAVFTIDKGGLMYTATAAGQKFSYTARGE